MGFQFNTDFSTIEPNEGVGGSFFSVSDSNGWLCEMIASEAKENSKKDGQLLVCQLRGLEGPVNGKLHDFNVNIANPNQQAVQIGMGELSAIAHVTGHIRVGNSAEWHHKPFRVVIVPELDKEKQPTGRNKISKYLDANGNGPKDAGKGAMTQAGGNFGGGQQNNAGQGFQQSTGGQQQDPNANWGNGQNSSQQNGGNGFSGDPNANASQNGGGFGNQQNGGFQQNSGQNAQGGTPNPGSTFQPNNGQGGGFQQNNGGNVGGGWNR